MAEGSVLILVAGLLIAVVIAGYVLASGSQVYRDLPWQDKCPVRVYSGDINLRNWGVSSPSQRVTIRAWIENETLTITVSGGGGIRPSVYPTGAELDSSVTVYEWNWSGSYWEDGGLVALRYVTTSEPMDSIMVSGKILRVRVEVRVYCGGLSS